MRPEISLERRSLLLALAGCLLPAVTLGAHRSRTKPPCTCGIPTRAYQYGAQSRTVLALSSPARPVFAAAAQEAVYVRSAAAAPALPGDPLPRPGVVVVERGAVINPPTLVTKWFQWPVPSIVIDHCSISRPAVEIHVDGTWTLSLRADQNPLPVIDVDLPPPFNPWQYIKRNLFVVRIRCFATEGAPTAAVLDAVGQPCLVELPPIEFWVERAKPYLLNTNGRWKWTGRLAEAEAFARLDRAELEFFFR